MIKTAVKPKQAIEKSQASAGLLAYIATAKYADGPAPCIGKAAF